jgi:flagellar basal body-associated protein FliL
MLGKIIGKITGGESKLMTVALIIGPILVVAVLFILTHLLFTPKQPTSEEIVASIANKAMLGGIDPSIVGVTIPLDDNQSSIDADSEGSDAFEFVSSEYIYYKIPTTFVTNLKGDVTTVLRADIAVSTYLKATSYDSFNEEMVAVSPIMVSAILTALGKISLADFTGAKNLEKTAEYLTQAVNTELEKKNTLYSIDYVHFFELAFNEG